MYTLNPSPMKTAITLFCLLFSCLTPGKAQSGSWQQIPEQSVDTLTTLFPDAQEITWTILDDDRIQARFIVQEGHTADCMMYFNSMGELIEIHRPIDQEELTEDVLYTAISSNIGYEIDQVYLVESDRAGKLYDVHMSRRGKKEIRVRVNANGYLVTHVPTIR